MKRSCAVLCVWLVLGAEARGAAAPSEAETAARQYFRQGEAHYAAGKFAEALVEYEQGYGAEPLPGFLVNMAQCHRRLGHLGEARSAYQKFVLVAPDSPLVPEVRSLIAELDKLLAPKEPTTPDPLIAGPAGTAPRSAPNLRAPAPSAAVGTANGLVDLAATSEARDSAASPEKRSRSRWWLWGALATATLGGVVALVALGAGGSNVIHDGTLGTLRR